MIFFKSITYGQHSSTMKRPLSFLLVLQLSANLCQAVTVTQNVPIIITKTGKKVEIPCEHDDTTGAYNMYWYQQKPGEGLKLMALSIEVTSASVEKAFEEKKWNMSRLGATNSILIKVEAESEDTAVYFCASSRVISNDRQYFGQGTILSVLETNEQQKPPQVKIFPPNKKEFKDHNLISLVCVASGFYPEHVRLNWTINGEPRNGLYQNVAIKNKDGKSFSTSKRLSLTRSEYFNPDNKFRCEAGFIGNSSDAFDEVNGESDCGVSKESYAMYINQGKISYIMVLFKSGLYALIVLAIIWRRKVLSGSC